MATTTAPHDPAAANPTIIGNTLEADDHDDAADSALGDESDAGSATTSLASSIMRYRQENGRTYHAYKDGVYIFPNDERESDRLDLQHHLFLLTFHGKLFLAPINENPLHILDVGTGTGIWALDVADEYPGASVVGIDLSPTQPKFVPPNLSFVIDDIEDAWTFSPNKFDFIHHRMMVGSFLDWPKYFTQCYDHLVPGGWIEMQDIHYPIKCDDDSLPDDAPIKRWSDLMMEASAKIGRPMHIAHRYRDMLKDAGFVDIQEVHYKWPTNTWPKGKPEKELGAWTLQNLLDGLHGFTIGLLTRALGWTVQEVEVFLIGVRQDAHNRRIHSYWPIHVVYARKPEAKKLVES